MSDSGVVPNGAVTWFPPTKGSEAAVRIGDRVFRAENVEAFVLIALHQVVDPERGHVDTAVSLIGHGTRYDAEDAAFKLRCVARDLDHMPEDLPEVKGFGLPTA